MIYDVRHVTRYAYEFPEASASLSLRVTPRSGLGQRCLEHALLIDHRQAAGEGDQPFIGVLDAVKRLTRLRQLAELAGRHGEAETVYWDDLSRHPNNGWALFGLAEAMRAQGKIEAAKTVEKDFGTAWAQADITLKSSRF